MLACVPRRRLKGARDAAAEAAANGRPRRGKAYHAAGRAERTAILDATRTKIGWTKLFVVHRIRVADGRAYVALEQSDPDSPGDAFERFSALCRTSGTAWECKEALGGSDATNIEESNGKTLTEWLKTRYPSAPDGIFE